MCIDIEHQDQRKLIEYITEPIIKSRIEQLLNQEIARDVQTPNQYMYNNNASFSDRADHLPQREFMKLELPARSTQPFVSHSFVVSQGFEGFGGGTQGAQLRR